MKLPETASVYRTPSGRSLNFPASGCLGLSVPRRIDLDKRHRDLRARREWAAAGQHRPRST
eukprot:6389285-Alexandrium_andersonii.AAC.1